MKNATIGEASVPSEGEPRLCKSIEWYSEGETRIVDVDGVQISIRFVGRRGRRGRIAITAPPGALFCAGVTNDLTDG
jgi:hypothetical protein